MIEQQLTKLRGHMDRLFDLAIGAWERAKLLEPMMRDDELNKRIGRERKGAAFSRLRIFLYWDLINEIVKLTSDDSERCPSIRNIVAMLKRPGIREELRAIYSKPITPAFIGGDVLSAADREMILNGDRLELEREFDNLFQRTVDATELLLSSSTVVAYQVVRDKLIAHNEVMHVPPKYEPVDISKFGLKFGEERKVLKQATEIVDNLYSLILRTSFDWDRSWIIFENESRKLWDLPLLKED